MELFYRRFGSGQPFIILHGLFGMSDNWLSLAKRFAENYNVFLLDLRNHGQSPHDAQFNYRVLSDDLLQFIDDHHLKDIILLGHSLGGKTIMNFALNHSELPQKLIIVDIARREYETSRFRSILQTMRSLPINEIKSRAEAENYLSSAIHQKGLRLFLLKNIMRDVHNRFKWKLNVDDLLNNIDAISQRIDGTHPFTKPVLLVYGGKSDYVKTEDIVGLKRLFPALDSEVIPGTTHWLHAEAPDEFYRIVMNFLFDNQN